MGDQGRRSPLRALQRLFLPGAVERHQRQQQEAQARSLLDEVVRDVARERERVGARRLSRKFQRGKTVSKRRDERKFTKAPKAKVKKLRRKRDKMAAASRRRNRG